MREKFPTKVTSGLLYRATSTESCNQFRESPKRTPTNIAQRLSSHDFFHLCPVSRARSSEFGGLQPRVCLAPACLAVITVAGYVFFDAVLHYLRTIVLAVSTENDSIFYDSFFFEIQWEPLLEIIISGSRYFSHLKSHIFLMRKYF